MGARGSQRADKWVFTTCYGGYNQPTLEDVLQLWRDFSMTDNCRYIKWGQERAPTTGQRHLQGYLQLHNRVRLSTMKQVCDKTHFEIARGSVEDNQHYVAKENTGIEEYGTAVTRGARTDLENLRERIKEGATEKEIVEEHFSAYIRYNRGILRAQQILSPTPPRSTKTHVCWIWGPTGTGKSHLAHTEAGPDAWEAPTSNGSGWWAEGYMGQRNAVIDEFNGDIPLTTLLRMMDKYPLRLRILHGSVEWVAENLWITSQEDPRSYYPHASLAQKDALVRRIDWEVHQLSLPPGVTSGTTHSAPTDGSQ